MNNNELKAEIRSALDEIINDGIKNIGGMLVSAFCGDSSTMPTMPTMPASDSVVTAQASVPQNDELLKIVSGYLYMALGELKYERKAILPIMQRIEKHMRNSDCETALAAYEKAENEHLALLEHTAGVPSPTAASRKIAGVEIPAEFHDYSLTQLVYISSISKTKTINSLKGKGITHIRDLFKPENSKLSKILSAKGKKSFVEALERTVAGSANVANADNTPIATALVSKPSAPEIPKRDVYEINGVVIPEGRLNRRVDSLRFPNKISRTKITKKLKGYNVVYLRDFFREGTPPLHKMLSQGGKKSFLAILGNSVV